jgi:hypothetical protein
MITIAFVGRSSARGPSNGLSPAPIRIVLLAGIMLITLFGPPAAGMPVHAQSPSGVPHRLDRQIGGASHAVAFTQDALSDLAWIGSGPSLVAVDLCPSVAAHEVGRTPPLPGIVHDVVVDVRGGYETMRGPPSEPGALAWVAGGGQGLIAVDVSRPISPWPLTTFPLPGLVPDVPGEAQHVVLARDTAWVGGPAGVHAVDVADERRPELLRHIGAPAGGFGDLVHDLVLAGEHVLVAWGVEGMHVLSATRGAEERGAFRPQGIVALALTASADGRWAYLAEGESLVILAISATGEPTERGRLALGAGVNGRALALVEHEDLLLVATRDRQGKPGGLRLVDVADPTAPRFVAMHEPTALPYAAVLGFGIDLPVALATMGGLGRVLWTEDDADLRVVDPRLWRDAPQDTRALRYRSLLLAPPARAVAMDEDLAWLAGGDPLLRVVEPFGFRPPILLRGTLDLPGARAPISALAAGPFGALAVAGGVYVVDRAATELRVTAVPGISGARDVALAGAGSPSLAVVAHGVLGLETVDLSTPEAPRVLGRLALADAAGGAVPAEAVAAGDGLALAVDGLSLHVVDLFVPDRPRLLARVETAGGARDVALGDELALIAAEFAGLHVYDLTEPTRPVLRASLHITTGARAVAYDADANRAWIAAGSGGVLAVDLRDPSAPRVVATFATPGWAEQLTVVDGDVLVADGAGGLLVLADPRGVPVPSLPPPQPLAACRMPQLWLPALTRP